MRVRTGHAAWIVPPNRALWVPAGVQHEIRAIGAVRMRTLYSNARLGTLLPPGDACALVTVAPLLQALIADLIDIQTEGQRRQRERHIVALILDEVRALSAIPLCLPWPGAPRLRPMCEALRGEPGSDLTSAEWAARFGLSARTLERDFLRSFGMTFGRWRQQLRLLAALERLSMGEPVTRVALDLGYASPSAFSAMFRKALGTTPSAYFR
jgi:AraC-like DNA-binding protein